MWKTLSLTAYADERFNIVIPWGNVLVTDWPVGSMTIGNICCKIEVTQSEAHAGPEQRSSSNNIPTDPIKPFYFCIWIFLVIDIEFLIISTVAIMTFLHITPLFVFFCQPHPVRKIPRIFCRCRVIRMFDRPTAFKH